ncbi:unnamed protein product [Heligmosomoides polygyrus]|uniref:HYR domain-containing protein n=1 Tax=Heligmosomoides polygyrus TaxID=6339 RepID=A0A183FAP1_HELPZ|nr:unnamed protein product [Heligmosomoides polygyrus]
METLLTPSRASDTGDSPLLLQRYSHTTSLLYISLIIKEGVSLPPIASFIEPKNSSHCFHKFSFSDKIPPLVTSCPRNIRKVSANRLTRVDWNTTDMFTDNVGIASIKSNYRSGQSFTWGYYRVVYTASDAAGNTAACAFSVVVSPSECQTPHPDSQAEHSQRSVSFRPLKPLPVRLCGSTEVDGCECSISFRPLKKAILPKRRPINGFTNLVWLININKHRCRDSRIVAGYGSIQCVE